MNQSTAVPSAELEGAFSAFNDLSRDLVSSYRDLEDRVFTLNRELAEARSERWSELLEKERLAQRFELLVNALPGGVVVLDGDGRVGECNPAATALLGIDARGLRWRDVVASRFTPRADDGHDVSLRGGRRVNISTCSLGGQPGQILLLKDVTETRQRQEQAARLERLSALGRTVASLAHQIRTPLAAALLYASALDRGRSRDRVVARLRQLENLVEDMLAYARRGVFEVSRLPVAAVLEDFVTSQAGGVSGARIALEFTSPREALAVPGNREALTSALQNLVDNAREAGGPESEIRLTAGLAAPDTVELRVEDEGPGIPCHLAERVFDPFFTTREAGTGLGLAVVRTIIHAHRGQVSAAERPGGGACFVVTLPRAEGRPGPGCDRESIRVETEER